ncbi:MAG: SRPBCC family protein [Anaerolineae bacterium]|nr:SRPBCC family protein [Anaerolineae bacterium]
MGWGRRGKFDTGGGETAEQIETFDDANKTLTYTILHGTLPVQDYHATIKVLAGDAESCTLEWSLFLSQKVRRRKKRKGRWKGCLSTISSR